MSENNFIVVSSNTVGDHPIIHPMVRCNHCGNVDHLQVRMPINGYTFYGYCPKCDKRYAESTNLERTLFFWNHPPSKEELKGVLCDTVSVELYIQVSYRQFGAKRGYRNSISVPEEPDEPAGVEVYSAKYNGTELYLTEQDSSVIADILFCDE